MPDPDPVTPLPPERLYRAADIAALSFETTRELAPLHALVDQPRAHEAIRFGTGMAVRGFNIFAIGANGARIQTSVRGAAGRCDGQPAEARRLGLCQQLRHAASAPSRSRCRQAARRRSTRPCTN